MDSRENSYAGPTGTEHLRKEQFGRHSKPYTGKRRGQPAPEAGSPPGRHRADHKHEAPYSAGKDIGHAVGSTKKAEYKGKHQKRIIPHAEGKQSMAGGMGRSDVPPPPDVPSKSAGGTDNAKSHAKTKANTGAAKNGNKKPVKFKFKPSRHEGKNKEHLKALVH